MTGPAQTYAQRIVAIAAKSTAALNRDRTESKCFLVALVAFAMLGLSVSAAETNAPAGNDYQSFKVVNERNIFNQNRTPNSGRVRPAEKQVRIETFSLLGTLRYEKGDFAFFDGSSSEYKKVLKPSDTIGGYTIAQIGSSSVKLASTNNQVELPVGMQMKRQDEGEWQMLARSESDTRSFGDSSRNGDSSRSRGDSRDFRNRGGRDNNRDFSRRDRTSGNNPTSSGGASDNTTQESSGGASPDEVLRRLMERRQRE